MKRVRSLLLRAAARDFPTLAAAIFLELLGKSTLAARTARFVPAQ